MWEGGGCEVWGSNYKNRFHTMNLCIQNSFVELNTSNLVG